METIGEKLTTLIRFICNITAFIFLFIIFISIITFFVKQGIIIDNSTKYILYFGAGSSIDIIQELIQKLKTIRK